MRKLIAALALMVSLFSLAPAALADSPVRVVVGITELDFDTPPIIEAGRTLVPIRTLAEALGFQVSYDPAERRVTLTKGDKVVELWVGFTKAKVNGKDVAVEAAPKIVGDRTLVPLRFVSEQLGAVVTWNEKDRLVHVARGEEYARGLYETAVDVDAADPFADQKVQGKLNMTMKMSGPGLPPGGVTIEMPTSMALHLHKGEMLMNMTIAQPGPSGSVPMNIKMAYKDGKMYSVNPGTQKWVVNEGISLEDALQANRTFDLTESVKLQGEMLQGANFSLAGIEEVGGKKIARVDVHLSTASLNQVFEQLLGPLAAASQGENMKMTIDRFSLSQWIDTATGRTQRVTLDVAMAISGSENGVPVQVQMAMTGDIKYEFVSEPIQFPDLSGAVSAGQQN